MKYLLILAALVLTGCGAQQAIDATREIPGKMDKLNDGMEDTNESIRMEKLSISKQNLEDPANAYILTPVPTGLMGYAKVFGEAATAEELVLQVFLYLKEVNVGNPYPKLDENGVPRPSSALEIAQLDQFKMHRFMIAQTISGLAPQETIDAVIAEQIDGDGRHKATALAVLSLRFMFIRDVMLEGSLLADNMDGAGVLTEALDYIDDMEKIALLPYISSVGVKIVGFSTGEMDLSLANGMADVSMSTYVDKINERAKGLAAVKMNELNKTLPIDAAELNAGLAKLEEKVALWVK